MSRKSSSAFLTALAAAAITFSAVQSSQADDTQRVRIRGVVESLNGDVLTIKTRDGSDQSIAHAEGTVTDADTRGAHEASSGIRALSFSY